MKIVPNIAQVDDEKLVLVVGRDRKTSTFDGVKIGKLDVGVESVGALIITFLPFHPHILQPLDVCFKVLFYGLHPFST